MPANISRATADRRGCAPAELATCAYLRDAGHAIHITSFCLRLTFRTIFKACARAGLGWLAMRM